MKVLVRVLILMAIMLTLFFYSNQSVKENDVLEAPNSSGQAIPQANLQPPNETNSIARPTSGLSTLIGQDTSQLISKHGGPNRIEESAFGYKWWIYNESPSLYMMVGVNADKINQVYIAGNKLDAAPFQIQQSVDELYRFTIIQNEISVLIEQSTYTFSLGKEDIMNRILVEFNGLYAQVYIDSEDREIEAVRFTDPKTLVLHQPYEMGYQGDYLAPSVPSTFKQQEIDEANERQTFDLTNLFRLRHDTRVVEQDLSLSVVARKHSEDMAIQNYFSHESPDFGDLEDRLKEAQIPYKTAGENIAAFYYDPIEVVHGWLNSKDHREMLLNEDFTHVGSGAFGKYYTQNFVGREMTEVERADNE
ncbi:MAG: CAP domain-containing protein [Paenisporosarcina sp.]